MADYSKAPVLTASHLARSEAHLIRGRWHGETVVIIGGGPSLTGEDVSAVSRAWERHKCRVIAVNNAYMLAPWADVKYSNDADWYAHHLPQMQEMCAMGEFWCGHPEHTIPGVHLIPFDKLAWGMPTRPECITWGGNSGAAAISLAALAGASKIILLGYDQQGDHWHEPHAETIRKGFNFPMWAKHFKWLANDIHGVVNCSRQTALDCFRASTIEAEL